jgi:hypothetical protein
MVKYGIDKTKDLTMKNNSKFSLDGTKHDTKLDLK